MVIRKEAVIDKKKCDKWDELAVVAAWVVLWFFKKVLKKIADARDEIEEDKYNKLLDGLANAKGKTSADE